MSKTTRIINSNGATHILERILYWSIYALAFLPLIIFSDFLSPFHFGKAIVLRIVVEIMALLYVALIAQNRKYLPPLNPIFWAVTIFTALYGITSFTGFDVPLSIWGSLERMGGFYSLFHIWLLLVMMLGILRTRKAWLDIIRLSIVVGLLSAFYGFLQKTDVTWIVGSGGRNKIFGTLGNPALFAGYEIFPAFFALMFFFSGMSKGAKRYYYLGSFLLLSLSIVLSGVRGSVAGLVFGFFLFLIGYSMLLGSRTAKKLSIITIAGTVIFMVALISLKNTAFVKNDAYLSRFSDFSISSYTVQTRLWTWQSGLEGWRENARTMILGFGPENFNIPFSRHFNPKHFVGIGSETLFDRAHNMFIEVLVTMGLVGEIAYIALFVIIFSALVKIIRDSHKTLLSDPDHSRSTIVMGLGLATATIAYIIHNFFIFDTTSNYQLFFYALGLIVILAYEKRYNNAVVLAPVARSNKTLMYSSVVVLSLLAMWSIYNYNIKVVEANYATTRAIIAGWQKDTNQSMLKYKEALDYDTNVTYDLRNRLAQYVIDEASREKVAPIIAQNLNYTIDVEKLNAQEHLYDYIPLLYIARLNVLVGKGDANSPSNNESLKYSLKALELAPTFVRTYFEVSQAYLNKKDYPNAIKYFREAVALNPDAAISNWYLGSALIESGQADEGLKYLKLAILYHYVPTETEYLRLIGIFVKRNDNQNIATSYEGLVKIAPDNPQYHASLAAAYVKIGKIDQAVEQARIAAKLDPTFEAEARAFVKSLGRQF